MSDFGTTRSLRVLHITNWYPTEINPLDGIWIKRQIESLPPQVENDIRHVQVEFGDRIERINTLVPGVRLRIPIRSWLLVEIVTSIILVYVLLFRVELKRYDLINFHIAYPLCVFLRYIQPLVKKPVVINEHWSAYHLNFGVDQPQKLSRIKAIFSHRIKLITVSTALAQDIRLFADQQDLDIDVVPNVVNNRIFRYNPVLHNGFLMAGFWKYPKDPLLTISAFSTICCQFPDVVLRIAGHGPLVPSMQRFIEEAGLQNNIVWLGQLNEAALAIEMQQSLAFVHLSKYETFSVVCAEAICCGTPVIASSVGGIKEFINDDNGYLVSDHSQASLTQAMEKMLTNDLYDRKRIADAAADRFNPKRVGELYYQSLIESCAA